MYSQCRICWILNNKNVTLYPGAAPSSNLLDAVTAIYNSNKVNVDADLFEFGISDDEADEENNPSSSEPVESSTAIPGVVNTTRDTLTNNHEEKATNIEGKEEDLESLLSMAIMEGEKASSDSSSTDSMAVTARLDVSNFHQLVKQ